jgi:hypothetical protein
MIFHPARNTDWKGVENIWTRERKYQEDERKLNDEKRNNLYSSPDFIFLFLFLVDG